MIFPGKLSVFELKVSDGEDIYAGKRWRIRVWLRRVSGLREVGRWEGRKVGSQVRRVLPLTEWKIIGRLGVAK